MKTLQLSVPFLFLVLFLVGCKQKEQVSNIDTTTHCPNEVHLFSVADSLKKIKVDYQLETKSLLRSLEEKLSTNVCGEFVVFGLTLTNGDMVKVKYKKMCNNAMISCFIRRHEARALLNKNGLLLMEHELILIDSIKYWMRDNYIDGEVIYKNKTSICWYENAPKDSIEKVFTNIKQGYNMIYKSYSQEIFSKKICDLNVKELNFLKETFPLTIRLDLERTNLIPLPPPPIETIEE